MMQSTRTLTALIAALATIGVVAGTARAEVVEPFEGYVQGPLAVTSAEAEAKALEWATRGGVAHPTVESVTSAGLLETAEANDPANKAVRESMAGHPGQTAYEESRVWRVLLDAPSGEGFHNSLSTGPPRSPAERTSGGGASHVELVYDQSSGSLVRWASWSLAIPLGGVPNGVGVKNSAALLRVLVLRASGTHTALRNRNLKVWVRTTKGANVKTVSGQPQEGDPFKLPPGRYVVGASLHGYTCHRRTITLGQREQRTVKLICSR